MNLNERESIPLLAAVCLHGRWHNVGFYAKVVAALQATLRGRLDRVKLQYALLAESRYTGEAVVPSGNRKYQFSRRARHITHPVCDLQRRATAASVPPLPPYRGFLHHGRAPGCPTGFPLVGYARSILKRVYCSVNADPRIVEIRGKTTTSVFFFRRKGGVLCLYF